MVHIFSFCPSFFLAASALAGCSRWCHELVVWVVMVEVNLHEASFGFSFMCSSVSAGGQ